MSGAANEAETRITHEQAMESAQRLINSFFRQEPSARVQVPARPGIDDDLVITAYIKQQEEALRETDAVAYRRGVEEAEQAVVFASWKHAGDDAYSQGMDQGARHQVEQCVKAIRALLEPKEETAEPADLP